MTPLSIALKQNVERKSRELKTPAHFYLTFQLPSPKLGKILKRVENAL